MVTTRRAQARQSEDQEPSGSAQHCGEEIPAFRPGRLKIFLGGITALPQGGEPSGIFKHEQTQPVWLGREGLAGDMQADRRVHGGVDKALHQYPVAHYARLAAAFPAVAALLVRGSIGENLSVPGWDEHIVHLGDVFRLGRARIEVSQPRSPCWKINRRYGQDGIAQFIAAEGLTGWYFRVLDEGEVAPGCGFELLERRQGAISVAAAFAARRKVHL